MFQVLDKIDKIIFYLNKNKIMIFNNWIIIILSKNKKNYKIILVKINNKL